LTGWRHVANKPKLYYLAGQFPAINHGYLLAEIQHLREFGIDVSVASVSPPDRSPSEMSELEREEAARTYYIKSVTAVGAVFMNLGEFLRNPFAYLRGLIFALQLSGGSPRRMFYHATYFAEAILVGRRMRESGIKHVYANFTATVALIATRVFPVTMSFAVHGFGELYDPVGTCLAERIEGALFVRSVSRYGRGQLMLACGRSHWSKLLYVPLGIDVALFVPGSKQFRSSPLRLLCVGRLAPEKGQALLLDAVAALRSGGYEVQLRLAGDGPDRTWLEARGSELGIAASLEFVGWADQSRLLSFYAEADLFVLPSFAEGIPVVLMEAMAMQVPCVAPRIAGIPELIEDNLEGLLFDVGDVEDLTKKIAILLQSPDLRQRIGKQARARVVRDYDMGRNTERFAASLVERLGVVSDPHSS
jgi:colanic acid/amylovoran biosynthesis glycosyltransferase